MDTYISCIKKRKILLVNLVAMLIFILFALVSNWSIVIGENLMKYDIWDAEYPMQVLMSDALANHTIPMWNPLMRYGVPSYAMVGTPVWYPITLLLAFFGYKPNTVAICYAIHIAIAGYGMFLLSGIEIKKLYADWTMPQICCSVMAGLLYCGSGLFLSNAQHIMIIISAAWIPYVFFFTQCYLKEKHFLYAMLAGASIGMILLGGYPEIFYNLFLFLVPYVIYFSFRKEDSLLKNLFRAVRKYMLIGILTAFSSAITLLPFLMNMKLIPRGNGVGQAANPYPFSTILSLLFSQISKIISGIEPSMTNYYMGIIVILLIPIACMGIFRCRKFYAAMAIGAFILCRGRDLVFHTILYRFFPMYSSFRFPTLNRAFIAIFAILFVLPCIYALLESRIERKSICWTRHLLICVGLLAVLCTTIGNLFVGEGIINATVWSSLEQSAYVTAFIIAVWLFVFTMLKKGQIRKPQIPFIVMGAVCIETLVFFAMETPLTIAAYAPGQYSYDVNVQDAIDKVFLENRDHNQDINFAGHKRSTNGLNSQSIVYDKTFDEIGYVSFYLSKAGSYLNTYARSITEQNPVVYFTNNVVTKEDISCKKWLNSCSTPPEQIFAEKQITAPKETVQEFNPEIISETDLQLTHGNDGIIIEGDLGTTEQATRRIRLYFGSNIGDAVSIKVVFVSNDSNRQKYKGTYQVHEKNGRKYIDIYFPAVNQQYQKVILKSIDTSPRSASLVVTDRLEADPYVDVYDFGFNSIGMNVDAPTEGYVTLLQMKHRGWKAYVDGKEAEIELINNCFMGILLPPGEHTIVMRFRPIEFFVGVGSTLAYYVILLAVIICYFLKRKKRYTMLKN